MEDSAVIYRSTFRPGQGPAPVVDVAGGRKEVVEASVRRLTQQRCCCCSKCWP
jgi:hypothetical protein